MNYDKITEALQTLKDMCEKFEYCQNCPCGSKIGDCLICGYQPIEWNIVKLKKIKCLE